MTVRGFPSSAARLVLGRCIVIWVRTCCFTFFLFSFRLRHCNQLLSNQYTAEECFFNHFVSHQVSQFQTAFPKMVNKSGLTNSKNSQFCAQNQKEGNNWKDSLQRRLDRLSSPNLQQYNQRLAPMILFRWLLRILQTNETSHSYTTNDIISSIAKMLLKIDSRHFTKLATYTEGVESPQQAFVLMVSLIERYLSAREFKRLSSQFQKEILAKMEVQQLLSLVLYVAVNSCIKNEVVQTILEENSEDQAVLMKEIQEIESACEKCVEFKKIVEKIELVQQENEVFRENIAEKEAEIEEETHRISELQAENYIIGEQIREYEEDKRNVLTMLEIPFLEDYVDICQRIKTDNSNISSNLSQAEQEKALLFGENRHLKKSLAEYGKTIRHQIQEIERLKETFKLMRKESGETQQEQELTEDIPLLPLQGNFNWHNMNNGGGLDKSKVPTDRTCCSTHQQDQEQFFENKQNMQMLININQLEQEFIEKSDILGRLKTKNHNLHLKKANTSKLLRRIQDDHTRFMHLYDRTTTYA